MIILQIICYLLPYILHTHYLSQSLDKFYIFIHHSVRLICLSSFCVIFSKKWIDEFIIITQNDIIIIFLLIICFLKMINLCFTEFEIINFVGQINVSVMNDNFLKILFDLLLLIKRRRILLSLLKPIFSSKGTFSTTCFGGSIVKISLHL